MTSITIKNAEQFPFMIVSLSALVIDKSLISEEDFGEYKVVL